MKLLQLLTNYKNTNFRLTVEWINCHQQTSSVQCFCNTLQSLQYHEESGDISSNQQSMRECFLSTSKIFQKFASERKFGLPQFGCHAQCKMFPHKFFCHGLLFHLVGDTGPIRDFLFGKVLKFAGSKK